MELDPRTLIAASVLSAALLGMASIAFALLRHESRILGAWGMAMLVLAGGLLCIGLRGAVPDWLSIAVGNTAIAGALVLASRGLRVFVGEPTRDVPGCSLVAALFLVILFFSEMKPDHDARVFAISAAVAAIALRAALLLHRRAPPACRLSCRFTEWVFWITAAATAARVAGTLLQPSGHFLDPQPLNATFFLANVGFIVTSTLGVMAMEIESMQSKLLHAVRFDSLTGLHSRSAFLEEFAREESRARRGGAAFSLVIFDLDHFKQINDRYGHPAGDQVLTSFADVLRATIRRHDTVGRYGGEEFALLMPQTGKETAAGVAERVRHALETRGMAAGGRHIDVTVSAGVASFGVDGADWDELLSAADTALYEAKKAGRNRVTAASPLAQHAGAEAMGIK